MLDALNSILGYLEMGWQLLLNFVEGIGTAVTAMYSVLPLALSLTSFMPGIVASSIVITISLGLTKAFAGSGG